MTMSPYIRIFISSTFFDMQEEREEIIKRIFPQIKASFEQRRITVREVDLRWGIPQSEIDEGKLLEICLEEVANCSPFFICFLGNRYGTVIKEIPHKILSNHPWLQEHQNKSLTELEILKGVFINTEQKSPHAFFYLRESLNDKITQGKYDREYFDNDDEAQRNKLDDLKNRIRNSSFVVREYSDPRQLGKFLFDDLTALIETLFPPENVFGFYDRETLGHRVFAERVNPAYSGFNKYFNELDRFTKKNESFMFVTGEVGSGKSSLLAGWVLKADGSADTPRSSANFLLNSFYDKIRGLLRKFFSDKREETLIFTHFVGSTNQSYDWAVLLKRFMAFLREHFQLELEIPEPRHLLPAACAAFFQAIPKNANIIVVIDAIDEIKVDNAYSGYSWLPSQIPGNVKIILSAKDDSGLGELRNHSHKSLKVKPLQYKERSAIVTNYLQQYRKKLDQQTINKIALVEATANPLYLTTVLEELRLIAQHETELNELTEYYLSSKDLQEIFIKFISRLEKDFDHSDAKKGKLVGDTLRLLWTVQSGLSEDELAELLGSPDEPLPAAVWSPFYIALKKHLLNRDGFLTFFHDSFRQTVEKMYLTSDEEKLKSHRQIADYFKTHKNISRCINELPRHLAVMNEWRELANLLADPDFFNSAWKLNRYEVRLYWSLIEENSAYRLPEAYHPMIDSPEEYKEGLWALISLLNESGYTPEVYKLVGYMEGKARIQNDFFELQACLSIKAELLKKAGNLDESLKVLQENEKVCRKIENQTALAACLGNQAVILYEKGKFDSALELHEKEEMIYRRTLDLMGLSISLGNQALNWQESKDTAKALSLLKEQEKLCRQLGDLSGLQKNLCNQGVIYKEKDNFRQAAELLEMSKDICRKLNFYEDLLFILGHQAKVFEAIGNFDKADEILTEREEICRKNQNYTELANALWTHSKFYHCTLQEPDSAIPLTEEALKLAKKYNNEKLLREIGEFVFNKL